MLERELYLEKRINLIDNKNRVKSMNSFVVFSFFIVKCVCASALSYVYYCVCFDVIEFSIETKRNETKITRQHTRVNRQNKQNPSSEL